MLAVEGLVVKYGGIEALHGVSLRVDAGEIVGVLGPNGAGKSSALNGIIGLVRPARGHVAFEGGDITGRDTESIVRRGLALVPERRRLFGRLSVRDNLTLGAASRRDKAAARQDLERVMDLFPVLRERLEQEAGLLSGGEAQQLAIARAMMSAPRLLLLDEPSLGLAPLLVEKVFELVQTLRDEGLTILVVETSTPLSGARVRRPRLRPAQRRHRRRRHRQGAAEAVRTCTRSIWGRAPRRLRCETEPGRALTRARPGRDARSWEGGSGMETADAPATRISITVNGREHAFVLGHDLAATETLADVIRDDSA